MKASRLRLLFNVWPPFLFAGIHVTRLADDFSHARVELRQRWYNRNYVGTHFGGSLFAMTDPFWMILVMRRLGPGYLVWDQAGEVKFEKPGRGVVVAEFDLTDAVVEEVRAEAGLEWRQIDLICVTVGPGSFTRSCLAHGCAMAWVYCPTGKPSS